MPLDHMLAVMHDESADKDRRDRMAIAAAPYLHPRLAVIRQHDKGRSLGIDAH